MTARRLYVRKSSADSFGNVGSVFEAPASFDATGSGSAGVGLAFSADAMVDRIRPCRTPSGFVEREKAENLCRLRLYAISKAALMDVGFFMLDLNSGESTPMMTINRSNQILMEHPELFVNE